MIDEEAKRILSELTPTDNLMAIEIKIFQESPELA